MKDKYGDKSSTEKLSKPIPDYRQEDYYIENGLLVFTSTYHMKRGYCCGSQCRHCPYGWEKVKG